MGHIGIFCGAGNVLFPDFGGSYIEIHFMITRLTSFMFYGILMCISYFTIKCV